jgi:DNA-binding PadR family transcriptional regulator
MFERIKAWYTLIRIRGRKEQTVLQILEQRPDAFGVDIVLWSNGALERGTVYVTLAWLQDRGLIESSFERITPPGLIPRRQYRLTESGHHSIHRSKR